MNFIRDTEGAISPEQRAIIEKGYEDTQGTVPFVDGAPDDRVWVFDKDERPIGSLSAKVLNDNTVEVGLRFWERSNVSALLAAEWIEGLLDQYPVVVARCYPTNWPVKKLLQRGGFRLLKIDDEGIEYHVTTKDTFLGTRKEPRAHGG